MIIDDMNVKTDLTFEEFEAYSKLVAQNYFNENGEYAPYLAREAMYFGFIKYCTGIKDIDFDKDYEGLRNHTTLLQIYEEAVNKYDYLKEVYDCAKDMADYQKELRIHNLEIELSNLVSTVTKKVDEFSINDLTDLFDPQNIISALSSSGQIPNDAKEIIEEKNRQIRELKEKLDNAANEQ